MDCFYDKGNSQFSPNSNELDNATIIQGYNVHQIILDKQNPGHQTTFPSGTQQVILESQYPNNIGMALGTSSSIMDSTDQFDTNVSENVEVDMEINNINEYDTLRPISAQPYVNANMNFVNNATNPTYNDMCYNDQEEVFYTNEGGTSSSNFTDTADGGFPRAPSPSSWPPVLYDETLNRNTPPPSFPSQQMYQRQLSISVPPIPESIPTPQEMMSSNSIPDSTYMLRDPSCDTQYEMNEERPIIFNYESGYPNEPPKLQTEYISEDRNLEPSSPFHQSSSKSSSVFRNPNLNTNFNHTNTNSSFTMNSNSLFSFGSNDENNNLYSESSMSVQIPVMTSELTNYQPFGIADPSSESNIIINDQEEIIDKIGTNISSTEVFPNISLIVNQPQLESQPAEDIIIKEPLTTEEEIKRTKSIYRATSSDSVRSTGFSRIPQTIEERTIEEAIDDTHIHESTRTSSEKITTKESRSRRNSRSSEQATGLQSEKGFKKDKHRVKKKRSSISSTPAIPKEQLRIFRPQKQTIFIDSTPSAYPQTTKSRSSSSTVLSQSSQQTVFRTSNGSLSFSDKPNSNSNSSPNSNINSNSVYPKRHSVSTGPPPSMNQFTSTIFPKEKSFSFIMETGNGQSKKLNKRKSMNLDYGSNGGVSKPLLRRDKSFDNTSRNMNLRRMSSGGKLLPNQPRMTLNPTPPQGSLQLSVVPDLNTPNTTTPPPFSSDSPNDTSLISRRSSSLSVFSASTASPMSTTGMEKAHLTLNQQVFLQNGEMLSEPISPRQKSGGNIRKKSSVGIGNGGDLPSDNSSSTRTKSVSSIEDMQSRMFTFSVNTPNRQFISSNIGSGAIPPTESSQRRPEIRRRSSNLGSSSSYTPQSKSSSSSPLLITSENSMLTDGSSTSLKTQCFRTSASSFPTSATTSTKRIGPISITRSYVDNGIIFVPQEDMSQKGVTVKRKHNNLRQQWINYQVDERLYKNDKENSKEST